MVKKKLIKLKDRSEKCLCCGAKYIRDLDPHTIAVLKKLKKVARTH